MNKKNCIVAQSGGPTVAINSSLAGVIKGVTVSSSYDKIYGSVNGILGILENRIMNLSDFADEGSDTLSTLMHTPAMYLGSCRFKLPADFSDTDVYETIFAKFEELNIGAFFYIGGNDSMDTVLKLSAYAKEIQSDVKVIGVPKTIDNDLTNIDHTPGFGSAAKYIATSLLESSHDTFIYATKSVTIVEIMGRDAGWLTAASVLARNSYNKAPHLIYLPETAFDKEQFLSDVADLLKVHDNVIVAISEGIHDKDGNYVSATEAASDTFGHSQLSGAGKTLEYLIKDRLSVKVRSVEINVLQRSASHLASQTDLDEAFSLGETAVRLAEEGITASMATLKRESNHPYSVSYGHAPIAGIANEARMVPREWINEAGNDVLSPLVEYLQPLILGEPPIRYENGLPKYMDVSHLSLTSK